MTLIDQIAADVATFFDPASGFGIAATFKRSGELDWNSINVTLDKAFIAQNVGADIESSADQVAFATADWSDANEGDLLQINDQMYSILDPQKDGLGVTVCTLTET
jgi:hypothetical protein